MFLRKEIVQKPTGLKTFVPYCGDCHSQDIEVIRRCRECNSQNIKSSYNIMDDNNYYGIKIETKEVTEYIYKCDMCGKEFSGNKIDKYLSYANGEFEKCDYKKFSDAEYDDFNNYYLDKDLCNDCKGELKTHLQVKLADFIKEDNINKMIDEYINKHTEVK